ncbi:hypothetical protein EDB85DRAFT_2154036 [Lactarius pseudohatsudake]|nr:hypothetical protein EDB85DRAFT_2154036 [Lactarius pseudohatsudake]
MPLGDKGGHSGELSGAVSELAIDAGVDSSSRPPSTRDGDSVAGGQSLDAGKMGSKPNAEGGRTRFAGNSTGNTHAISGTSPALGDASERVDDREREIGMTKGVRTDETEDAEGKKVSSESSSVAEGASEYDTEEGVGWDNEDGGVERSNVGSNSG